MRTPRAAAFVLFAVLMVGLSLRYGHAGESLSFGSVGTDGTQANYHLEATLSIPDKLNLGNGIFSNAVTTLRWSPDGQYLAGYASSASEVLVWNASTTKIARSFFHINPDQASDSLEFTEDGSGLIITPQEDKASDPAVTIVPMRPGAPVYDIPGPSPTLTWRENHAVAFATNARKSLLAVQLSPLAPLMLAFYNTTDWRQIGIISGGFGREREAAMAISFSPRGDLLAVGKFGTLSLYDTSGFHHLKSLYTSDGIPNWGIYKVSFSPDGSLLALASEDVDQTDLIVVLNPGTGQIVSRLRKVIRPIDQLGWSPDGKSVLFIDAPNLLRSFDPAKSVEQDQSKPVTSPAVSFAVSRDRTKVAVSTNSGINVYTSTPSERR